MKAKSVVYQPQRVWQQEPSGLIVPSSGLGVAERSAGYGRQTDELVQHFRQVMDLLTEVMEYRLRELFDAQGLAPHIEVKKLDWPVDAAAYEKLVAGKTIPYSWYFMLYIQFYGRREFANQARLAYIGRRSDCLRNKLNRGAPSVFWSNRSDRGLRRWSTDDRNAPFCLEMSISGEKDDRWYVRCKNRPWEMRGIYTSGLARAIAEDMFKMTLNGRRRPTAGPQTPPAPLSSTL